MGEALRTPWGDPPSSAGPPGLRELLRGGVITAQPWRLWGTETHPDWGMWATTGEAGTSLFFHHEGKREEGCVISGPSQRCEAPAVISRGD